MTITKKNLGRYNSLWHAVLTNFPTLAGVLNLAFSHGGYVAGGFPRLLSKQKTVDFQISDVDLWFHDINRLEQFVLMLKESESPHFHINDSLAGLAYDISFAGTKDKDRGLRYKLQVIRCRLGNPETVIGSFDIRNCMIGFDRENVWEDEERHVYEEANMLDIANWNNPHLVTRVAKYIGQHGYRSFSEGNYKKFVEWLWNEYHNNGINKVNDEVFYTAKPRLDVKKVANIPEKDEAARKTSFRLLLKSLIETNIFKDEDLGLFMTIFVGNLDRQGYGFIGNPALDALAKSQEQKVQPVEEVTRVVVENPVFVSQVVKQKSSYYDPSYDYF